MPPALLASRLTRPSLGLETHSEELIVRHWQEWQAGVMHQADEAEGRGIKKEKKREPAPSILSVSSL